MKPESETRGMLRDGVDAFVRTLDLEAGRRFASGEKTVVAPRIRLTHSDLSVDRFVDAVGADVRVDDAHVTKGGVGAAAAVSLEFATGTCTRAPEHGFLAREVGGRIAGFEPWLVGTPVVRRRHDGAIR